MTELKFLGELTHQ